MLSPTLSLLLFVPLLLTVVAQPTSSTPSITWTDCKLNTTLSITCGTLPVPLDYTDASSNETLDLQFVRLKAVNQPKKGSVLFNPGGPGIGGRNFLIEVGEAFQIMTGGDYDLIGFDPRGTGETIPFSCYQSTEESLIPIIEFPAQLKASDTAPGTIWAAKEILAATCRENAHKTGELIGTAFVARDMMQIVDAVEDDGMLRFYGASYGTALGATVAAMFPDRMDKIVLDGVLNMDEYYAGTELQQVTDSDATYAGFFKGCVETPELCSLAKPGLIADKMSQDIAELLEQVKYSPIPLGTTLPTELVDFKALKTSIFTALYAPSVWPYLALLLDATITRNVTSYLTAYEQVSGVFGSSAAPRLPTLFPEKQGSEAVQGIRCSDTSLRVENISAIMPLLREFEAKSYILGDQEPVSVAIPCAAWKMQAKERFTGPFENVKTKNPVLFLSNTYDPLTPLISAKNVSAGFVGSTVLEVNGYGHTTTSQPSLCAAKAIQAYFVNGTMPDAGTVCQPSVPLFRPATVTFDGTIARLNDTKLTKRDDEDGLLIDATDRMHSALIRRFRPS